MSTEVRPWAMFNKEEMVALAAELGLEGSGSAYAIAHAIHDDLGKNGVPPEDECSELLDDYLFSCEYIDDDGMIRDPFPNLPIIEQAEEEEDDEDKFNEYEPVAEEAEEDEADWYEVLSDVVVVRGTEYPKYECWSMAEDRDSACRRCKVFQACSAERVKVRPPCFGRYMKGDEQCEVCLEALPCSQVAQGS